MAELKPVYDEDGVRLYRGDCADVLPLLPSGHGVVITDPPFSERTHKNARSGNKKSVSSRTSSPINFRHVDDWELTPILSACARVSKSWVVANLDYSMAVAYEHEPPKGMRVMRVGAWVKTNPMPQLTGDRPAQGWEAIAYFHKPGRASWNGGGHAGNFYLPSARLTEHPTEKPMPMVRQFIEWFTEPGDVVIDPFAGSGTTLLAARELGRRAIGIEKDPSYCNLIQLRLAQGVLPL